MLPSPHRASSGYRICRAIVVAALLCAAPFEQGCRAQQRWPFWDRYAQQIIDGQGRVVDHAGGDRTTSEGQAYALFFALVANDRDHFDKLLNWTEANLAGGDLTLRLPAWSWGKNPDGSWKVMDANPASDADLWMAYSLTEAGRLWREPRYEKLGALLLSRIAASEVATVPGVGTTLLPGPTGFHPEDTTWILNPSYLPPPLLLRFSKTMPQGPWSAILRSVPHLLAPGSGFAMDWLTSSGGTLRPSLAPAQQTAHSGPSIPVGSYDAIRVYLWLGLSDRNTPEYQSLFSATHGMAAYLARAVTPPVQVNDSGAILSPDAPVGFSAAVIPYLHALGMKAQEKTQVDRLAALHNGSGLYGRNSDYYDQNLALFATGWIEQRFRFDREGRLIVPWGQNSPK